jgi:hypothetical protein
VRNEPSTKNAPRRPVGCTLVDSTVHIFGDSRLHH